MWPRKYMIRVARADDMFEGMVWVPREHGVVRRQIVKVVNLKTHKSIYCEASVLDENFLDAYNQPPRYTLKGTELVMGEWYREKLGVEKNEMATLLVVPSPCSRILACLAHPQVSVKLSTSLGVLSLVLGLLSVALGVIALYK
ncbi:hypothetical protein [Halodesulfovibrio sp.]|uniref:hypothetical protein n=1 Tax=Halodesulfovibrio sp. TaxID=1912772 RepID=UPI0025B89F0B|nr:hypothetical protein [Halodesulfovibrio sp.]